MKSAAIRTCEIHLPFEIHVGEPEKTVFAKSMTAQQTALEIKTSKTRDSLKDAHERLKHHFQTAWAFIMSVCGCLKSFDAVMSILQFRQQSITFEGKTDIPGDCSQGQYLLDELPHDRSILLPWRASVYLMASKCTCSSRPQVRK